MRTLEDVVHALADQFRETFTDFNDDPDSVLYGRPGTSSIGGGSTEAQFTVELDRESLAEEGIEVDQLDEYPTFSVHVKVLE